MATSGTFRPPTGHVLRVERKRGPQWYAKYRLPDGRQVQKRLGPAWTERGRPPAGYFNKRLAEDWLRRTPDEARRGTLPGMVRTGATFADAAAEYLRYIGEDRGRKASTVEDYRSIIRVHLCRRSVRCSSRRSRSAPWRRSRRDWRNGSTTAGASRRGPGTRS